MKQGIVNAGVRGFSLIARFVLAAYLVKFYELSDVGLYGLLYSVTAAAPALLGFGINFSLNREVAVLQGAAAIAKVRDRLILSFAFSVVSLPIVLAALYWSDHKAFSMLLIFPLIYLAEIVAQDLHFSLISLRKPVLANLLLFFRSAAWVYPFIAFGFFIPETRTMGALLALSPTAHREAETAKAHRG